LASVSVAVRVLGEVSAEAADGSELDLGGPRQRALLALLVSADGRAVSADALADRIWDGKPPASAPTTLQGYVARLRRALEPGVPARQAQVLVTRGDGYALCLPREGVDARVFQDLLDRAAATSDARQASELLGQALGLWRGRAYGRLADLEALRSEALRLDELRVHAVEQLAAARLRAGSAGELVPELRRLAAEHPLREQPHVMLAHALYRAGRQAEALDVLRTARARLADELGLDAGPALVAMETAVLRHDPALLSASPRPATAADPEDGSPPDREVVGRDEELALLQTAWRRAAAGSTTVALVTGEPGIGKTTLVRALSELTGAPSRWGRFRQAAGAPPFWTWQQVLGGLPQQATAAEGIGAAAERARFLVALAVADELRSLAASGPLLVVLDDLQWADADSLHVLDVVLAEMVDAPLLLVVTCRTDALQEERVAGVTGALSRRPGTTRVALSGLPAADVLALYERRSGVRPTAEEASELTERTGGNPFFVQELAVLRQRGAGVPDSVRDVVRMHLQSLGPGAAEVIGVAAVAGRDVAVGVLARALGRSATGIEAAVTTALRSGLLQEVAPGRLRFAHDLVREAVLADLSPPRRAALHAGLADALEPSAVSTGGWAAVAVARSEAAAGGPDERAATACLRAAREALRRAAVEDAAAMSARGLVHATTRAVATDLWHVRGVACRRAGLPEESTQALEQVAALAREAGDWPRLAAAALAALPGGVGGWSAVTGALSTPDSLLLEAHSHLTELPADEASAVLAALSAKRAVTGDPEAVELADAAVRYAPDGGLAAVRARIARFVATWSPDTAPARLRLTRELAAAPTGDLAVDATVLHLLRCALLENGLSEPADVVSARFRELAESGHDEDLLLLDAWWTAGLHQMRGEHGQAREAAARAARRIGGASRAAAAVDVVSRDTLTAISAWQRGDLLAVLPTGSTFEVGPDPDVMLVLALAHAEAGQTERARRMLRHVGDFRVGGSRGTVRTVLLTETAVALGDTALLARLLPILDSYGNSVVVLWPGTVMHGPAAVYRGAAAQALGLADRATADLHAAAELADRIGAQPYAERARARLAGRPPWPPV
jgi:DNA-binding SARP family transcriptional activator